MRHGVQRRRPRMTLCTCAEQFHCTYIIYQVCGFVKPFAGISVQNAVQSRGKQIFLDFRQKIMYNESVWIMDCGSRGMRGGCGETAANCCCKEKEKQRHDEFRTNGGGLCIH